MLARAALRIATVRALRGRTWAGQNVLDSELTPIDDVARDKPAPILVVYTDDGKFMSGARDLWATGGDSRVDVGYQHLVIELAMTQRMAVRDEDGNPVEGMITPETDAALELTVDLLQRQVVAALMDTAPAARWAELWRRMVIDVGDREDQRGSLARDGVRVAGRQIRLSVRLMRDPVPGKPAGPVWAEFLSLANEDASLAAVVPLFNAALAGTDLPDWRDVMRTYGLNRAEAEAMQLTPPPGAGEDPPAIDAIVVDPVTPVPLGGPAP